MRPRGSPAAARALSDPHLRSFDLGGFELSCGTALPAGARLAYRLHGPPIGEGEGIILHPTSFDCVHDEVEYNIGPGAALDSSRYAPLRRSPTPTIVRVEDVRKPPPEGAM